LRTALDRGSRALDRIGSHIRERLTRASDAPVPAEVLPSVPPAPSGPEPVVDLRELTKAELYRLAQERDIAGRSKLSKDQLVDALRSSSD